MHPLDLRLRILAKPGWVVPILAGLTVLTVWGNVRLQRGGLFDGDVILRADDPYRLMDRYVHQDKAHEGFDSEETIPFFLNSGIRSAADLQRALRFTEAAKERFGKTIVSLAEIPAYEDTGTALRDDPYITDSAVTRPDFHLREWKDKVQRDPSVFGVFVGRTFAWTAVVRYLPPGHDEITEFRRTAEFLEGRPIPWWEWWWKRDITPRDQSVGVGGWVMGRGILDQGLNVDMLTLVLLGVLATLPVFRGALGRWRHALLGVGVMVLLGFVWTRGIMGLLGMRERVFSVLVYANVIVQGTSFALHKFEAFADSGASDRTAGWRSAMRVDSLIAITATIAIFGFATLYSFGLRPIRELGVASACGVGVLLVLAVFFLPALDLLGSARLVSPVLPARPTHLGRHFASLLERLVSWCARVVAWLTVGTRPWAVVGVVCGLFAIVALLFGSGRIESRTRALEFLRGTSVERQARFLNQPGNLGFEFLDVLVEPAGAGDLYDPRFLARAWAYQDRVRTIPEARETASILSTVHQIAQASFKKPFPETRDEIDAAFVLIESRLAPAVQRQLYFPRGVRISVSYGFDNNVELGRFCERVLALAHQEFPDLKVSAFNKVPLYPRVDHYVRQGKIVNVFSSQLGVALICGLVIAWRNRGRTGAWLSPVRGGLVMAAPLFFATAVIGLIMWVLDIPLDMATAPIGALAINAATDFSLYLALAYQDALEKRSPEDALGDALRGEGKIILTDCLLNSICFLPLITSRFLPIADIGWMMGLMLVACAVGTLVVMAALLPRCVVGAEVTI